MTRGYRVGSAEGVSDENDLMIWGLIPLKIKVSSKDTGGSLFVFEHTRMGKGGPPAHVHHDQDEWFYATEGEFEMRLENQTFRLKPGDSLFAPRRVPHVWACVSETPGTLITALTPAGTFETFIRETTLHPTLPTPEEVAQAFSRHGMTVVGPPLLAAH
jgi:quercetin dioxygenase-like cupin family protein